MSDPEIPDLPDASAPTAEEMKRELEAIQPALRAYVGSLIGAVAEISDIVQEANLLIWHKRGEYQQDSNFKAYAFRVAYYKVMSFRRDQARYRKRYFNEQLTFKLAADAQALFEDGAGSRSDALAVCLGQLPPEHRVLLKEHYVDQVSITDIALQTRHKPSALHKTISRIRQALRHCISNRLLDGQNKLREEA